MVGWRERCDWKPWVAMLLVLLVGFSSLTTKSTVGTETDGTIAIATDASDDANGTNDLDCEVAIAFVPPRGYRRPLLQFAASKIRGPSLQLSRARWILARAPKTSPPRHHA